MLNDTLCFMSFYETLDDRVREPVWRLSIMQNSYDRVEAILKHGKPITDDDLMLSLRIPRMTNLIMRYGAEMFLLPRWATWSPGIALDTATENGFWDATRYPLIRIMIAWEEVPENVGRMIAELTQF